MKRLRLTRKLCEEVYMQLASKSVIYSVFNFPLLKDIKGHLIHLALFNTNPFLTVVKLRLIINHCLRSCIFQLKFKRYDANTENKNLEISLLSIFPTKLFVCPFIKLVFNHLIILCSIKSFE